MTSIETKIIRWKKLYQLISGTFYNENQNVIKKKLLDVTKEIQIGLSAFKTQTPDDDENVKKLLKEKHQEKLIPFTQKLCQFLNIEANQCYDILCYYLVNEYRGSSSSLQNFVSSESLMIKLLSDIWFYYSLERMVLLKVTKCLLEYYNSDHPYQEAFKEVIDKIGFDNLRKSYIEQFDVLVKDVQQVKFLAGDLFNNPQRMQALSERKHREMNEILQIILLTCHYDKIKPSEIQKLLELFKAHSFGKQNQFLIPSNTTHADLIQKVTYNEIALWTVVLSTANLDSISWMEEIINKLDDQVTTMHHYPEHGPILLSWMLFKFAVKSNETTTDHFATFGKLGARAVQLNVFEFLLSMMQHKMFNDKSLTSKIVAQCIYENLSFLCELFNADGSVSEHPKVYELFSEILKSPGIAKDFCKNDDNPIRSLLNSALEKFPHEFLPLSIIAKSLASASKPSHSWIVNFMQNLPIYTEQPTEQLYELEKVEDDDDEDAYVLLHDYQPFKGIADFIIPAGSRAVARDEKNKITVHFFVTTNYFNVLHHEINEVMSSIMNYSEIKETKLQRLQVGISFLATILPRFESPNDITNEMIHPTELVFDILNKFKTFQMPSLELMAACIDVCSELVGFFGEEIFRRFVNLKIAPSISSDRQDFKAFANGVGFEPALVGYYLINIERAAGRYTFLKAYLNFLKSYSKLEKNNVYAIELPGLIFLLREVLVHAHMWHFEKEQDQMDIFLFVFEYLHDILTISPDVLKGDPDRKLLRDVCIYSLLNLEQSVALLKHVGIGNPALITNFIVNETNWFVATDSNLNLLVLNAMRVLMQILRLKDSIPGQYGMLSPLEQLIYTQPKQRDALKIIPIVTSYTTYPFNRRFAVLTCRLLRRFAIEFQSSLSACIDMEPDQLRLMFLQRLRDDLESEDLKIAVLDFVISCIDKQSGLTEAFFKVTYEQDKRNQFFIKRTKEVESMADGILTYMEEYLEAIEKDPSKTTNLQLKKIMSLFHALWKQGLQSLVKDLIKKEKFWSSLCSPLLASPISNYQYSQLFNILGIELFKIREPNNAEDENFKKVLTKFLEKDAFNRWLDVVFDLPTMDFDDSTTGDETPEWLSRLQSFKDFLVILSRKKSIVKMPSESNKLLMEKCLDSLLKSSEDLETGSDTRPFVVLTELYLVLLNDQKVKYTSTSEEDGELLKNVESLMKTTAICYNELHKRAKDSILSIVIKILDIESDEIHKHPDIALSLVRCNVEILCTEFFNIENQIKEKFSTTNETEKNFSVILALNLMKKLVLLQSSNLIEGNWSHWFNHHKIFNRLLSFTSTICQMRSKCSITAEALELLVLFAKGIYSKELIYCDLGDYLWMKLIPPKELLERSFGEIKISSDNWTPQEWWIIYEKGIQLVKLLLEQHSHLFIKEALFFVGIHEEYLTDCLMLAKTSLEPNAIKLIKATQELLCEVVRFDNFWRVDYFQSVMSLMRCIQSLLDTSVSLLHRPKILKRLTEASKTQLEEYSDTILTDPSDELVAAMNELIEIITLCSKSLLQFSPKLLSLLCDTEFYQNQWTSLIEVQFGAPKINTNSFQQLSFGTLLSAVAFFVKVLNLTHHSFKQVPLNQLPNEEGHEGSDTVTMFSETAQQGALSPISPRVHFSKSLSMTSASSSVVQASNELISHLDSKLTFVALEYMLTLLASQSLLALKNQQLSSREKQLIRRELSNELYCFHDFVKKKIVKDSSKSVFYRQKLGVLPMVNNIDGDDMDDSQPSSSRSSGRRSQDLRVNVVRKQHLKQKAFDIPTSFSPILQHHQKDDNPNTPLRPTPDPITSTIIKRVGFDLSSTDNKVFLEEDMDEEPFVVNRGDPSFTGLSFVKMVEEDYLHLLSNLFMSICQNEN